MHTPSFILLAAALPLATSSLTLAAETIEVPEMVVLDRPGATYDFKGATLVWTGPGDCSQREGMSPMFSVTAPRVTLRNATIVGAPDGIHIHSRGVILENLTFPDVCEDAITFKRGSGRATVRDCHFANAADKAIQATGGRWHRVYRCTFTDCKRPFRSKPGVTAAFYQNIVSKSHSAVRADGRGSRTWIWGNTFREVRHPIQRIDKALVIRFLSGRKPTVTRRSIRGAGGKRP